MLLSDAANDTRPKILKNCLIQKLVLYDSGLEYVFETCSTDYIYGCAPSAHQWGWTIGLGTEWVVDGHWSIFGEWDYLNFGNHNVTFTDPNAGSSQINVKQSINELKLGINYRFGTPLPQVVLLSSARHTNPIVFNLAIRSADITLRFARCVETQLPSLYSPST